MLWDRRPRLSFAGAEAFFRGLLEGLDAAAAAKVTVALARMEQGNLSKVKGVGPASLNIAAAQECRAAYKRRKKQEIQ